MQDWEFKELSLCDREDLGERCISVCRYPLGFAGMGFFVVKLLLCLKMLLFVQ